MKAPVFYMSKIWISPEAVKSYIRWFDIEHIASLSRESRFLWVRRCRLEGENETGRTGFIMIYGIDSPDSLKQYFDSPVHKGFVGKLEQFKDQHEAEHSFGALDFDLSSPGRAGDEEAKVLYFVKCSVAPKSQPIFLEWLGGGHLAEVTRQPGFLWVRGIHLNTPDKDGWERYIMIYGQASLGTLKEYFSNPIRERFSRETEPFANDLRRESFFGPVEFAFNRR